MPSGCRDCCYRLPDTNECSSVLFASCMEAERVRRFNENKEQNPNEV